ncbi:MAG: DUF6974 family protein [Candidatus Puniceispirillales bacterium]|jgi:hypothetical protein|nr:hypothetical protein [Alphaproteobacteria bacterium]MBL6850623.1 hypothetical protein [Alphaproteobacteria bacterium]
MSESKLISYITSDFQSKSDMKIGEIEWEKIMNDKFDEFKKAGAIRQTVTQIWNKEGALRLGHLWEYKDEKAFIACQKIFREAELEFKKRTGIIWKVFPNRGIVLYDTKYD